MKLYEAYSTFDYRGFKDVHFHWFASDRTEQELSVTPEEALSDYHDLDEKDRFYALDYIAELLTESEVDALNVYLEQRHHGIGLSEVKHVELPIKGKGIMGVGAMAVGGPTDFYMLSRERAYDIETSIWGYFDLRDCEMVKTTTGGIVVGHDDEGETVIVITLKPGDGFSWEHPLCLMSHVSQILGGIAPSQLGQGETMDELPF